MSTQVKMINARYLEKLVGASIYTIDTYLCRAEFSHIKRESRKNKEIYYFCVTNKDVERLKELIEARKAKRRGLHNEY